MMTTKWQSYRRRLAFRRSKARGWTARSIDLLLGCGGIYTFSIAFLLALMVNTGARPWPVAVSDALGVATNAPHRGATLVRLCEREQDRHEYSVWSPWHFSAQS